MLEPHDRKNTRPRAGQSETTSLTTVRWGAGFAAATRFVDEIEAAAAGRGQLRPGYVLAGDEAFLLDRCRSAILKEFVPVDLRDFCLSELDLNGTSIFEALDRAQTPSLMAPFQVVFIRSVRQLYTRGAKKEEFAHPFRHSPDGDGRQEPIRAAPGDAG
jgi:DNA polymerase III subunit delta